MPCPERMFKRRGEGGRNEAAGYSREDLPFFTTASLAVDELIEVHEHPRDGDEGSGFGGLSG